jgi:hypothetical protein
MAGHLGRDKSIARLRQSFWWPNWYAHMVNHVASCVKCNQTRTELSKNAVMGELEPIAAGDVWERLGIDILGPLPPTKLHKYKYVLVAVDYVSKFSFAIPLKDIEAWTVGRTLMEKIFTTFGVPRVITSDRGQPFVSKLQTTLLKLLGTTPAFTSPYHPASNGMTERTIKSLSQMIQAYVNEYTHDDWDAQLTYILFAHRTTIQASTLEIPFYLMFGRDPQMPGFLWKQSNSPPEEWEISNNQEISGEREISVGDLREEITRRLQIAWDLARENIRRAQEKQQKSHNARSGTIQFRIGDRVWLAIPQFRKSNNLENATAVKKFAAKWSGPHRVVGVSENGLTYRLMEMISPSEVIYRVTHVRRLRHFTPRKPVDPEERISLDERELLSEEMALVHRARVLRRHPFRPRAYGTSKELTRRGLDPDQDKEANEEGAEEEWELEAILDHTEMTQKKGGRQFFVKWRHHSAAHNGWVPFADMSAPQLLLDYYKRHGLPLEEINDLTGPAHQQTEKLNPAALEKGPGEKEKEWPQALRRSPRSKRGRVVSKQEKKRGEREDHV